MTLGVRAIVENEQGNVLLVRHGYTPGLFLPGGGVERGETLAAALARELEEEGGVRLTGEAKLLNLYSNHSVFPNDHVALFHVTSDSWKPVTPTASLREISDRIWTAPDVLPDEVSPGTRVRFEEVFSGRAFAQHWSPGT